MQAREQTSVNRTEREDGMNELKCFEGYRAVRPALCEQLPVGGHAAMITGVKMEETAHGQHIRLRFCETRDGSSSSI